MTDDTDHTDETPSLHRDGLPFPVAAHGWCAAAGAAGAYVPAALEELLLRAEEEIAPPRQGEPCFRLADALRSLGEPDWHAWLAVAVPAAREAANARHDLAEALARRTGRAPAPAAPSWGPDAAGVYRLRWVTGTHEAILGPSLPAEDGGAGHGWALTVWAPCTPSYRTEAAEAAMRAAEERLGLAVEGEGEGDDR